VRGSIRAGGFERGEVKAAATPCFNSSARDQNAFEIAKHIVVPESKHPVTFLGQSAITDGICSRFMMLPAVDLNNQTSLTTDEIADVAGYRFLPDEFLSVDLPATNAIPENCLRVGLVDP
jgi:hypothetical protein